MIIEKRNAEGQITGVYWDGRQWKDKPVREETRAFIDAYKLKYPDRVPPPAYLSTYGELFFLRYVYHLTTHDHLYLMKVIDFIEGKDGQSFNLFGINGNIEVKTVQNHLTRNNAWIRERMADHEPTGTIPFEVFHRWDVPAEDRYQGWLLSMYNYKVYNAVKQQHGRAEQAETPGTLAFMLMKENKEPFACVAFEDMKALLTRLYEILPFNEWDLDTLTIPPATDTEYWSKYIRDGKQQPAWDADRGGMIQNCWHVPFKRLADLATVTMIGDVNPADEIQKARFKCPDSIAEKRLTFLQDLAAQQGRETFKDPDAFTRWETEYLAGLTEQYGDTFTWRNRTHGIQQPESITLPDDDTAEE